MKITRKVLSILLALVMALSCFTVIGSAANPRSANCHLAIELALAPGTCNWTSNTAVSISEDEECSSRNITGARPGDIYWVKIYATTDYYVGTYTHLLYYSANLMDISDIYSSQRSGRALTATSAKKVMIWNPDCEYEALGKKVNFSTPWSLVAEGNRYLPKNWPLDSNGDVLVDTSAYKFQVLGQNPDEGEQEEACMLTGRDDDYIYKTCFQIPADAQDGTTYEITCAWPEEWRTDSDRTKSSYINELGPDYDGLYEGVVDAYATNHQLDVIGNIDLSAATVTITVGDSTPATTIDYAALEAKYNAVKDTDVSNATTATKAAFNNALSAAAAMIDAKNADTQDAVDALTTNLDNAYNALKYYADYTALDAAITLAGTKTEASYTAASWATMQAALSAANNVARDLTTDQQSTVTNAANTLNAAIQALVPLSGADYTALDTAIALAESKTESWFTAASWSAMQTALGAAKAVSRDLMENQQGIIDTATSNLNTAIGGLVEADADYTALNEAKAAANAKNAADYTAESFADLTTALNAANNVAAGLKAKDQGIINTAAANLNAAIDALVLLGGADYTALDAAIAAGTDYAQSYYTDASWTNYAAALAAAQNLSRDYKSTQQALVDEAKDNLNAAKRALVLKDADYSAVDAAIASAPVDRSLYTADSLVAVDTAIAAVDRSKNITEQADVDGYAAAITNAIANLAYKPADTSALESAIALAGTKSAANFTADSYAALTAAVAAGNELLAGNLDIRDNTAISEAAAAINAAIEALVSLGADYSALDAAKAAYEALTASWYTAESFAAATTAFDAASQIATGLAITEQDTIDAAAEALNTAIANLVEADADYSGVDAAKVGIPRSQMGTGNAYKKYTDASWNALQDAVNAVVLGKKAKDQAEVDAWAAAIESAKAALTYEPFDFSGTQALIDTARDLNEMDYTAASWADLQSFLQGLVMEGTNQQYGPLHLQELNLGKKINALVPAPEANYVAVYNAQAEANGLNEADYTADSWAGLQTALGAVVFGLNENYQSQVDGMADAIMTAINNLVEIPHPADYSGLEAALRAAEALNEEDYTAETWAVLADAVTAGYGIDAGLTVDDQDEIDAAEEAILNAIAGLEDYVAPEEDADYAAYNAICSEAAALNASDYTAESWAALQEALVANTVPAGLKESQQETINAAVANIRAAIDALEEYVAPEYTSKVKSVTYEPSTDTHKTFVVTIEGRPAMVQFVLPSGSTITADRYSDKVTITSYDKDGHEVDSLDRTLAYEVWEINTNMIANGDVKVRGKFTDNSMRAYWEADKDAEGLYTFKVETLKSGTPIIYSVEVTSTAKAGKYATFTVEASKDTTAISIKLPNGSTATFKEATYAQETANGRLLYSCRAKLVQEGDNVIAIRTVNGQGKIQFNQNMTITAE